MYSRFAAGLGSLFSGNQPKSQWLRDEQEDVLRVEVPDFKKDELKVEVNSSGILRISGERWIDHKKAGNFRQSFRIPPYANNDSIKAMFDGGILHVIVPLTSLPIAEQRGGGGQRHRMQQSLGTQGRQIVSFCTGLVAVAMLFGLYKCYPFKVNNGRRELTASPLSTTTTTAIQASRSSQELSLSRIH